MKQFFFLLLFSFVSFLATSQDTIITAKNDTLDCKITRVTSEFIHFSVFDKSGVLLMRSRLPLSEVKYYQQSETGNESKSQDDPIIKEKDTIFDEFDPASFRLSINSGFTYQFSGYEGLPEEYKNKAQTLWNLGSEFHYFLSDNLGIGVEYNHIFTKIDHEFDPPFFGVSSIEGEKIQFNYFGVSFLYRNFLYHDRAVHYFLSGGLIKYQSTGMVNGMPFAETGDTFGGSFGFTYDFIFTQNFGVGLGTKLTISKLSELDANGMVIPVDFSISRIDIMLGFRLYK